MIRPLTFAALMLTLAACATTAPPYAAAPNASGAGYSEQQIESNRYSVTYRAPSGADPALLQDYALLRAADITLQNNHEWFWVDNRATDGRTSSYSGPSIGIGIGGASFGHHTAFGTGVGLNFPLGGHSTEKASSATIDIRFGEGAKPDQPNAYDARSVETNIRARLNAH
jgi:hypothetical protein